MKMKTASTQARAQFNASARSQPQTNVNKSAANSVTKGAQNQSKTSNQFTALTPSMNGPKPPAWVQGSVNKKLHSREQKRLALKHNLKSQFQKSAQRKKDKPQSKSLTNQFQNKAHSR